MPESLYDLFVMNKSRLFDDLQTDMAINPSHHKKKKKKSIFFDHKNAKIIIVKIKVLSGYAAIYRRKAGRVFAMVYIETREMRVCTIANSDRS